ncbi:hypothetical protein Hanom_Chr11g01040381 [Helianthus anomalus]
MITKRKKIRFPHKTFTIITKFNLIHHQKLETLNLNPNSTLSHINPQIAQNLNP